MILDRRTAGLSSARKTGRYLYVLLIISFLTCIIAPLIAETSFIDCNSISAVKTIQELNAHGENQTGVISFDILSVITAIGIVQGFFIAFLLLKIRSGNHRANRILALFLIVLSLNIIYDIYFFTGLFYMFPEFSYVGEVYPLLFLVCPLLYFYVVNLTMPSFRFKPIHLPHLLPALFAILFVIQQRLKLSSEEIEQFWISYINGTSYQFSITDTFFIIGVLIYSGVYLVLAMRLLTKHKKRIMKLFSSIDHINLLWLNYVVRFIFFIYTISAIVHVYWFFGGSYGWFITQKIFPVAITFYIFAIGYRGLIQHEIFAGVLDAADENRDILDEKTSIPPAKVRDIMDKLIPLMEEKKPYLNPELTLPMLAEMLAVPRNYLSQAINEDLRQNFFDFINAYRVKTAREYLEDSEKQDMNILDIAFAAGFNSKTTFNSVFKKNTSLTPTEYKKTAQIR